MNLIKYGFCFSFLLWAAAVFPASFSAGHALAAGPISAENRPNILLIVVDDLGYGDLSSYGADDLRTPNMDNLVESGIRFDRFYANSSVCSPTRAALLSGRFPDLVGVPGVIRTHAGNSWGYLDPGVRLLPDLLQDEGYHTAMVGKWHLGLEEPNIPTQRGFDHFKGWLGDMMDDYYTHRRHGINYMREGREVIDPEGHATDLFTSWAIEYIRRRSASEAPFFLYLAYNAPHSPIQPPDEWLAGVKRREPEISEERARLVALIEHLDYGIGKVVDALKQTGQYENTLILFTSDNGGALHFGADNGDLRGGKTMMYEGGLRVPMCAVWQGKVKAGSRSRAVASTVDLYPTLLEAAGAGHTPPVDGKSILPLMTGNVVPFAWENRTIVFVRREGGGVMGQAIYALRRGDWKLLQNTATGPFELYNLSEDPLEQNNLADDKREKYNELAELLRQHMHRAGGVPWQRP